MLYYLVKWETKVSDGTWVAVNYKLSPDDLDWFNVITKSIEVEKTEVFCQ